MVAGGDGAEGKGGMEGWVGRGRRGCVGQGGVYIVRGDFCFAEGWLILSVYFCVPCSWVFVRFYVVWDRV